MFWPKAADFATLIEDAVKSVRHISSSYNNAGSELSEFHIFLNFISIKTLVCIHLLA